MSDRNISSGRNYRL